jgi:hypothetical protein
MISSELVSQLTIGKSTFSVCAVQMNVLLCSSMRLRVWSVCESTSITRKRLDFRIEIAPVHCMTSACKLTSCFSFLF